MSTRKGFAVQMSKLHWLGLLHTYDALKHRGLTTDAMDEAVKLVPDVRMDSDKVMKKILGEERRWWGEDPEGSKTVRFRAEHIEGAKQLLRASIVYGLFGQAASTYCTRLDKLNNINNLDLLADAGR